MIKAAKAKWQKIKSAFAAARRGFVKGGRQRVLPKFRIRDSGPYEIVDHPYSGRLWHPNSFTITDFPYVSVEKVMMLSDAEASLDLHNLLHVGASFNPISIGRLALSRLAGKRARAAPARDSRNTRRAQAIHR
jgi:hypothetical protein